MNYELKMILNYFPRKVSDIILHAIDNAGISNVQEIRLFRSGCLWIVADGLTMCVSKSATLTCDVQNHMQFDSSVLDLFVNNITHHSMYKFKFQLGGGYVTIPGGHRVGVCGTAVLEAGNIKGFSYVCSVNIRICKDAAYYTDDVMSLLHSGSKLYNTCVISPPKFGKTTFAKNYIRYLAKRMPHIHICVCDERGELCGGIYDYNDAAGFNTSVITDCSKIKSAEVFVRCMSPGVIVFDEVWSEQDFEAVARTVNAGVPVLFTVHGQNLNSVSCNSGFLHIIDYLHRSAVLENCNGRANIVTLKE